MNNKVSKNFRLHPNDIETIRKISILQGGISATRVLEKAIMFYAVKLGIAA